jgi:hypothetical protein
MNMNAQDIPDGTITAPQGLSAKFDPEALAKLLQPRRVVITPAEAEALAKVPERAKLRALRRMRRDAAREAQKRGAKELRAGILAKHAGTTKDATE